MKLPFLGQIPIIRICESGDSGSPIIINENKLLAQVLIQLQKTSYMNLKK